jgi:hypothetical protein
LRKLPLVARILVLSSSAYTHSNRQMSQFIFVIFVLVIYNLF